MDIKTQNKIKIFFSVIFLVLGSYSAYLTFDMKNIVHYGKIKTDIDFDTEVTTWGDHPLQIAGAGAGAGGGVDSSNDGVAIAFGIIAGLSILSSALLLASLKPIPEKIDLAKST